MRIIYSEKVEKSVSQESYWNFFHVNAFAKFNSARRSFYLPDILYSMETYNCYRKTIVLSLKVHIHFSYTVL